MDSLAVVAAFARYKAGIPVTQVADELGMSEHSIRNHVNEKTKAGKPITKNVREAEASSSS